MADSNNSSQYVKLNEDQAPVEVNSGELNLPIDVPKLHVGECDKCGQPLPEGYVPPGIEPWTTGICGCADDPESLRDEYTTATAACVVHAILVKGGLAVAGTYAAFYGVDPLLCMGLLCGWSMCSICNSIVRLDLQKKYRLKNAPCDPCLVHCCMHSCALCQEHREFKARISYNSVIPMTTLVNAPPVQQMNSSSSSSSSSHVQKTEEEEE